MDEVGWASIQLDGGIEKVLAKVEAWFAQHPGDADRSAPKTGGVGDLRIALTAAGPVKPEAAEALAQIAQIIVGAGGTVVVPENSDLWKAEDFAATLGLQQTEATLAYAQPIQQAGFHIMQTPTQHWVETLVGVAACGVESILGYVGNQPMPGHPLVPFVQLSAEETVGSKFASDIDLLWQGDSTTWPQNALELLVRVLSHEQTPAANRQGNVDFQVTRGLLSVSL